METGQHGKLGGWCSAGLMTLSLVAGIAGCDPTTPQINEPADFSEAELANHVRQSYELVRAGLPKKIQRALGVTLA